MRGAACKRLSPARIFIRIAYEEREEKNPSRKTKLSPAVVVHPLLHRARSLAPAPPPILLPASYPSVVSPHRGHRRSMRRVGGVAAAPVASGRPRGRSRA
jgi:hypothetical protein